MAARAEVGSFNAPGATGNHTVNLADTTLTPKVILLQVIAGSTPPENLTNAQIGFGIGVSSTSRASVTYVMQNSSNTTQQRHDNSKVLTLINQAGSVLFAADLVSFAAGQFTINVTTDGSTYEIQYKVIGDDDIANVALVQYNEPTSTGLKTIGNGSFVPDFSLFFGGSMSTAPPAGAAGSRFFLGATNGTNEWTFSVGKGHTLPNAYRYQVTDACTSQIDDVLGIVDSEAAFNAFGANHVQINFTTVNTFADYAWSLQIKGGTHVVGTLTSPTSTGTVKTSGIGTTPLGILGGGYCRPASTAVEVNSRICIGFSDGVNDTYITNNKADGNLSDADSRHDIANNYAVIDNTPSVAEEATVSAVDSDSFTENFTTADATAREIPFWVVGADIVAGNGLVGQLATLGVGQ